MSSIDSRGGCTLAASIKGDHRHRTQQLSMAKAAKLFILHLCEFLGLFRVSAWLFRNRLHILCYHGFELLDECAFRPQLFISGPTFDGRLRYIADQAIKVLTLSEALERLRAGSLPKRALVITVDDGFKSTLSVASPLLSGFGMTATVYVTTYYMDKQVPIFGLGVQYVFWKANGQNADFSKLCRDFGDVVGPAPSADTQRAMYALIEHGNTLKTEQERQDLLGRLARVLDIDISPLHKRHLLSILSAEELRTLRRHGIDVQLHSHRHRFPASDRAVACREIEDNRIRLREATGVEALHFCYPNGIFDASQWPWLEALGVKSATTCIAGLNRSDTPIYGLRRFLDSESVEFIEFKAELAGFNEILRYLKRFLNPRARESVVPAAN